MNEKNRKMKFPKDGTDSGCGTSTTLNNTVGVAALLIAGIVGYFLFKRFLS